MSYIWQRWLADEFRAAGLTVIEVEGWKNRGRPASTGDYDPDEGITNHHTGFTSSAKSPSPALRTLIQGRSDLPGPLAQWTVRHDGVVVVIAAGRCNHAGRVGKSGAPGMPLGADGNARALGDEVDTNGTQAMPAAQIHAVAVTNAVALKHHGNPVNRVHRHKDISGTGKWDLGSRTTTQLRADAASALTTKDWFDMADKADLRSEIRAAFPDLVKEILDTKTITHHDDNGKTREVSLRNEVEWSGQRGQRTEDKVDALTRKVDDLIEALADSGK